MKKNWIFGVHILLKCSGTLTLICSTAPTSTHTHSMTNATKCEMLIYSIRSSIYILIKTLNYRTLHMRFPGRVKQRAVDKKVKLSLHAHLKSERQCTTIEYSSAGICYIDLNFGSFAWNSPNNIFYCFAFVATKCECECRLYSSVSLDFVLFVRLFVCVCFHWNCIWFTICSEFYSKRIERVLKLISRIYSILYWTEISQISLCLFMLSGCCS